MAEQLHQVELDLLLGERTGFIAGRVLSRLAAEGMLVGPCRLGSLHAASRVNSRTHQSGAGITRAAKRASLARLSLLIRRLE